MTTTKTALTKQDAPISLATFEDSPNTDAKDVKVLMTYSKPNNAGEWLTYKDLSDPTNDFADPREVMLRDVRRAEGESDPQIDVHGFQYFMQDFEDTNVDFDNGESVKKKYYPNLETFLEESLNAAHVVTFNHIHRYEPVAPPNTQIGDGYRGPAPRPHSDHDRAFGPFLLHEVLAKVANKPELIDEYLERDIMWSDLDIDKMRVGSGERADATTNTIEVTCRFTSKKRWAVVNVWRPLAPVERDPLVLCDRRTATESQFMAVGAAHRMMQPASKTSWLRAPGSEEKEHEWYYMSRQMPNQPVVFVQWDSRGGVGTPHSSVVLPEQEGKPVRRSVESRHVVLW